MSKNLNKSMTKKANIFLLMSIMLLAFFLRTFRIDQAPSRLTHDEMSIAYNAYSIVKTGKDEWGKTLPLDFAAFGDHKLPAYIYATVPFVALFDMNHLSLKLASILSGVLLVLISYFIALELKKDKVNREARESALGHQKFALFTATLIAISPWSIQLSRMAFESNMALTMFSFALLCILKLGRNSAKPTGNKKSLYAILAGIFFGLTFYTYIAYRLIIFLLMIYLAYRSFIKDKTYKRIFIYLLVSFGLILLPLSPQLFGRAGTARFSQVSIFNDQGIPDKVTDFHNFCFLTSPRILPRVCRLIYNKPIFIVEKFTKNYVKFLFPTFLFITGDKHEYLNDPNFAQFPFILSFFYLIGLFLFLKKKDQKYNLLKVAFFIAPIPSALVGEPQIVRGSALMIFIALFSALGLTHVIENLKKYKKTACLAITLLFAYSFVSYAVHYFYIYPAKYESYFYPLSRDVAYYLQSEENNYEQIYISNHFPDAHMLIAFYQKIDPVFYQKNVVRPEPDGFGFMHPTQLGKYYFGGKNLENMLCEAEDKTLYVGKYQKEYGSIKIFTDFSNVHKQAAVYDIDALRNKLMEKNSLIKICPDFGKKIIENEN